jgi:hypothetical protein
MGGHLGAAHIPNRHVGAPHVAMSLGQHADHGVEVFWIGCEADAERKDRGDDRVVERRFHAGLPPLVADVPVQIVGASGNSVGEIGVEIEAPQWK